MYYTYICIYIHMYVITPSSGGCPGPSSVGKDEKHAYQPVYASWRKTKVVLVKVVS